MNGCRPLTEMEINLVLSTLRSPRDKLLFIMGLKTGFRIQELLSIKLTDVFQYGRVVDRIKVQKKHMKNGHSRSVVLHPLVKEFIEIYMPFRARFPGVFLFPGEGQRALSRHQAWRILKQAFNKLELQGTVATHSMRKTFGMNVYEALGYDLVKTQKAMGHAHISSTIAYLPVDQEEVDKAILGI